MSLVIAKIDSLLLVGIFFSVGLFVLRFEVAAVHRPPGIQILEIRGIILL